MHIVESHNPFNKVDYFLLPNGYADVFLHKNGTQESDEDGNIIYKSEEVYFRIKNSITKEMVKANFDFYWENEGERVASELTAEERIEMLEDTINFLLGL